jgi:hypothetical protein
MLLAESSARLGDRNEFQYAVSGLQRLLPRLPPRFIADLNEWDAMLKLSSGVEQPEPATTTPRDDRSE